jgi:hypothetical protein
MRFGTAWQIGLFLAIGTALALLPMLGVAWIAAALAALVARIISPDLAEPARHWTCVGLTLLLGPYAIGMVVRSLVQAFPDLRIPDRGPFL